MRNLIIIINLIRFENWKKSKVLRKILIGIIAKSRNKIYNDKWIKLKFSNILLVDCKYLERLRIKGWEDLRSWSARWELLRSTSPRWSPWCILCREWCGQVAIYGWHLCELALAFFFFFFLDSASPPLCQRIA